MHGPSQVVMTHRSHVSVHVHAPESNAAILGRRSQHLCASIKADIIDACLVVLQHGKGPPLAIVEYPDLLVPTSCGKDPEIIPDGCCCYAWGSKMHEPLFFELPICLQAELHYVTVCAAADPACNSSRGST